MLAGVRLSPAVTEQDVRAARELFQEYARSLNCDLCFQGFEAELASLPGDYAPPTGVLLLAWHVGRAAGCVAVRRFDDGVCEMKRLYVRPEFRGQGLGHALAQAAIAAARAVGYVSMKLDTLASMEDALALYRSLGFRDTTPYRFNPVPGAVYLELTLAAGQHSGDARG